MPRHTEFVGYIAMSADGYIADEHESLEFLDAFGDENYGYEKFFAEVNNLVLGRKTFEWVLAHADWPYGDTPTTVLSHKPDDIDTKDLKNITATDDIDKTIKDAPVGKTWVIGGGEILREFLDRDRLDSLQLFIVPVLLGKGVPLFPDTDKQHKLKLLETKTYKSGMLELRYQVTD